MSRRLRREDVSLPGGEIATILTVCIGNVCRSPLAEQLIRARLVEAGLGHIETASAGLAAMVGEPMQPLPAQWSRHFGGDPSHAEGKQISEAYVLASDLILTLTRDLRDRLVRQYPRALARTFSLGEFVALLELDGALTAPAARSFFDPQTGQIPLVDRPMAGGFTNLVRAAGQRRSLVAGLRDDVADPMGKPAAVHEDTAAQINDLSERLVRGLARHLEQG